jgi:gas vesicle protein
MSEDRGSNGLGTVIVAGAIGAAVGAVMALLLAPRPGKETRADWGEKALDLVSRAKEKAEEVSANIRHGDAPDEASESDAPEEAPGADASGDDAGADAEES